MKKLLTTVLLISLLISGCSVPSARNILYKKEKFVSPDNTFSATFPKKPSHRTEVSEKNGEAYSVECYEVENVSRYLSISYGKRPAQYRSEESIEDIMEDFLNSFTKGKDIEIIEKNKITLDAYSGMECIMSTDKGIGRLILRIFCTEKRVYYVIAEASKSKIDSDPIREFLGSFKILKDPEDETASKKQLKLPGIPIELSVPDYWVLDDSEKTKLVASSNIEKSGILALSQLKENTGLSHEDYHAAVIEQAGGDPDKTEAVSIKISNYPAMQAEIFEEYNGAGYKYLITTIETDKYFHQILLYCMDNEYKKYKPEFDEILNSFIETENN